MYSIKNFEPRLYQKNILQTSINKNTLVCLPTGTGKTKSAILLAIERLNRIPESKILICTPTKPLSNQICEEFKDSTDIPAAQINLLTGAIYPDERKKFWEVSKVLIGTPQTFKNDIEAGRISLSDVSMLCIDECHRSKFKFANTIVAKYYKEQSMYPRIIALTASPGATKEKIDLICNNLFIEAVEIRSDDDEDVKPYIQEKEIEYIKVDLPKEILNIRELLKEIYSEKLESIKKFGTKTWLNKSELLKLQARFHHEIARGNKAAFAAVSLVAQVIKISYALELLETQTINSLLKYFEKLKNEQSKAAKVLLNNESIKKAVLLTESLSKRNFLNPKMEKLIEIVKEQYKENKNLKLIIFANYRATVQEIVSLLNQIEGIRAVELVGQKEGLSQKKQIEIIGKFERGEYNIIAGTSITEEGLSIGSLNLAIFYDHTASEIRKIQRTGRVARIKPGKIIYLMARKTRDESLFWTSHHKEKKMKNLLHNMKVELENKEEKQIGLNKF